MHPPDKSKAALVTGGSRGIGRAVAVRLAKDGFRPVFVHYLENDAEARATKDLIEQAGGNCLLRSGNLMMPQEADEMADWIENEAVPIGGLVHCAALGAFKPLSKVKANQWDMSLNVNARSFLLCVQRLLGSLDGASIVAISSLGSRQYVADYGAIGPSKAALEAVVRQLAVELAPRGIRVNAVSGGYIDTESMQKFPDAQRLAEQARARTPGGRLGTPEDIAAVVAFLLSPDARWLYGQTLVVDGGLSLL